MNHTINLRCLNDLEIIGNLPVSDILVQIEGFSRYGGVKPGDCPQIIDRIVSKQKKAVLALDSLFCESELEHKVQELKPYLSKFNSIRFLDPGLGRLISSMFPETKLELSLEHGSLNRSAIQGWIGSYASGLSKIILSSQLPLETIRSLVADIPLPVEILGFGPLEMFYSRRKLLEGFGNTDDSAVSDWKIASADRPDQLNQIYQTDRGTIAFYDKILNILSFRGKLGDLGVHSIRLEYQTDRQLQQIMEILNKSSCLSNQGFKIEEDQTKGFIEDNQTHQHFIKLTNHHLDKSREKKVGSVLESVKNQYTAFQLDRNLTLPASVTFISPEGRDIPHQMFKVSDLKNKTYSGVLEPGIYRIDWIKYAVASSIITQV
jgi:collagenase-like PrtC family protease